MELVKLKSSFSIFGGYKSFKATIAQCMLAFILLPALGLFIHNLLPDMEGTFFTSMLGEDNLFEGWLELLSNTFDQVNTAFNFTTYFDDTLRLIAKTIVETTLIGLCIYLCKTLGVMLNMRGVPILQTMIGVFLGCFMISFLKVSAPIYITVTYAFLCIANIMLTIFVTKDQVVLKVLGIFVGLSVQSIIAALACTYVAALQLIWRGIVTDLAAIIGLICLTASPLLIVLLIDYYLLTPKKERHQIN